MKPTASPTPAAQALQNAAARGQDMNLVYAGALTPTEAHAVLRADAQAVLVDVRTVPELVYVGRAPDSLNIEWQVFPEMTVNAQFCDRLSEKISPTQTILFLCRSGVRSHHAAAAGAAAGFTQSYNVLEGFEGDLNAHGHRNMVNGWRFHGLPWVQS